MKNKSWSMALYPCMRKYKWKLTVQLPRGLVISLIDMTQIHKRCCGAVNRKV